MSTPPCSLLALALAPMALGVPFQQESACSPDWVPTFGPGGLGGTNGTVYATAVVDALGPSPRLLVGGAFSAAGGLVVRNIGLWDGRSWTPLGSGTNQSVLSVAVLDDGSDGGPRLFAAGRFTQAGGVDASHVAEWTGSSWAPLAGGVDGTVHALAVFDDGGGSALHAAGEFRYADGAGAYRVAKWDGAAWAPLGSGVEGVTATVAVHALAVHDDGSGPALYAGGSFTVAGGAEARNIARWDGSSWCAVGDGREGCVFALAAFDDGSGGGPALYAGGRSDSGVAANRLGKWNGSYWTALGPGANDDVFSLATGHAGGSAALFAGGMFTYAGGVPAAHVARWDGSDWASLGAGTNAPVYALGAFDDSTGRGPVLVAGGFFRSAGDATVNGLGEWDGARWSAGRGLTSTVEALTTFDDGSGRGVALYVGGGFTYAGGASANQVARWDGLGWETLGGGMQGGFVRALLPFDDGSGAGPRLYAGGSFTRAGGTDAWHVARWDGSSWSQVGALAGSSVMAFATFDDGSGAGPRLYAGVNGTQTNSRVARWDGASWTNLSGMSDTVLDVAVFDDGNGSGPALYAAGGFQFAGGLLVNGIARWDGSSWSDVGGGMGGPAAVEALVVHDDGSGSGPALYAAGSFAFAGGVPASHVAKWDGAGWSALGSGMDERVTALGVFDDGGDDGRVLLAGGHFTTAGGVAAVGMAKWDGSSWSAFGDGTGPSSVRALHAFDDGQGVGPALYVGSGALTSPSGDGFLARWQGCADTNAPVISCPSSVFAFDPPGGPPGEIVSFTVTIRDRDPHATLVCDPPSGSFFPRGTTLVSCVASDTSGNRSSREFPVTVQSRARRR